MLTLALAGFAFWLCWRLVRGRSLWIRILIGIVVWVAYLWLAPQVYYTYYYFLFGDLPWQRVVSWPPMPLELFDIATFTSRQNLSFHGQGLLGWGLVLFAGYKR